MATMFDLPRTVLPARVPCPPDPARLRPAQPRLPLLRAGSARAQLFAVAAGFLAYSAVRFVTQGDRASALRHGRELLHLERMLGIDWERSIQGAAIHNEGVRQFFTLLYAWGYWPAVVGTLLVLWRVDRALFRVFRNALFLSGAVGLVVFALYPAAPPRMLHGFTDTVAESGQHFVAHPSGFTNPYAALPSFHAGWFFLAAVVLARATPRPARRIALHLLAPLMSVAVVVTANHYVVDVVLGVGLSLGALAVASRREGAERVGRRRRPLGEATQPARWTRSGWASTVTGAA